MTIGKCVMLVSFTAMMVAAGCSDGERNEEVASDSQGEASQRTPEYVTLAEAVSPGDSLSPLRFFVGDQITLNDRCPVRRVPLNPKMQPAYVNGRPVGFC